MSLVARAGRQIGKGLTRLTRLVQPQTVDVSKISIPYPPLFQSVPPVGFRYAPFVAIVAGTFTIGACDLVLNHWSRLEKMDEEESVVLDRSPETTSEASHIPETKDSTWVLRPTWQRATLAGLYVVVGFSLGVKLFASRARHVHRLHIMTPNSSTKGLGPLKSRTLFFQTCSGGEKRGHVAPLSQCKLLLHRKDPTQVYLQAKDIRGTFLIGTSDANINGKDISPAGVFAELAKLGMPYERLEMRPAKSKN